MKNNLSFPLLFAALLFAATSAQGQDLTQEVTAMAKGWQDAYNRADQATLATLYTNEVIFVDPADGTSSTATKEQIVAGFERDFSASDLQMEIKVMKVTALPDGKATVSGTFSGNGNNKKTGEKIAWSASYENIVVKEGGQWKLSQMKTVMDK